jgi:hypothetical protein
MSSPGPGNGADPVAGPAPVQGPDPMKGLRGVFAATLTLEAIVVALALLVLPKFGEGATPLAVGVIGALAVVMIVAAGLQRRPWGLRLALVLQVVMVACGLLVPALGVMGGVFVLVWVVLLLLRRDLEGKMARGELPSQQPRDP